MAPSTLLTLGVLPLADTALQAEAGEAYLQWRANQPWAPADDAPAHGP
jgi:hypothetical protein